ncbi:MAG: hypothetical protein ACJAS3_001231 [Roseivirga sp.]|jgi:hypothetical protein
MTKKISFILFILLSISHHTNAQKFQFDVIVGQYDHNYNLNGVFNQIITETSNTTQNLEFTLGLNFKGKILENLELQFGIMNYSTFGESMLFWDTTEDQIFGGFVKKAHLFGGRTYSFPLKIVYQLDLLDELKLTLGTGIEYFILIDREPIGNVNLGRQHTRLNDFLPRIDEAFFRNRLVPLFSVGLRYKRLGFELQTRINPKNSFSNFKFEGQEFQPRFSREISSFILSYNFLKLGR